MEPIIGIGLALAILKFLAWLLRGRPGDRVVTRHSTRTVHGDGAVTHSETVTTVTVVQAATPAPAPPPLPRCEIVDDPDHV